MSEGTRNQTDGVFDRLGELERYALLRSSYPASVCLDFRLTLALKISFANLLGWCR